jgi:hypothetical protein
MAMAYFKVVFHYWPGELEDSAMKLSKDTCCSGRESNQRLLEYIADMVTN